MVRLVSWDRYANGDLLRRLNSLHTEVVINATPIIATRPDITVSELRELLWLIEEETINVSRLYAVSTTDARLEGK